MKSNQLSGAILAPFTAENGSTTPESRPAKSVSLIDTREVRITAYSSTPDQTDSTPFITASGETVKNGIIAANFLPFGTEIEIPSLFGDRIFTVEDRMNRREPNGVDIWMPTRAKAVIFGAVRAKIVVVGGSVGDMRLAEK